MRLFPILIIFSTSLFGQYITYEFSGGRFGDCLLCYLHAKWLSYKYQIPLLYKPFDYSSDLMLDSLECRYQTIYRLVPLNAQQPFPVASRQPCIYVCPYFSEDPKDLWLRPSDYRFAIDWKDAEFRKIANQMIAPQKKLDLAYPPKQTVNIAIHIREGGGYDTDHTRLYDPLKLPPLAFYIEALNQALELFKGKAVYCRIFTDALNPGILSAELEKSIPPGSSVHFETRTENNHHTANVLEDFFSLFLFDVLIRPQSNYSIVVSLIHEFCLVVSPCNFKRIGTTISITETSRELNEELYQEVLRRTR